MFIFLHFVFSGDSASLRPTPIKDAHQFSRAEVLHLCPILY